MLQTNTFQCVLASDGQRSYALFLYADGLIEWTTGSSSVAHAQVGFNAGDGVRSARVASSGTPAIINISSTSNVNIDGMWIFEVDGEEIVISDAGEMCMCVYEGDIGLTDLNF